MNLLDIPDLGAYGVVQDTASARLPINAFTDARNMRFLDGSVMQSFGWAQQYGDPPIEPYHLIQVNSGTTEYWVVAGASKIYVVTITGGVAVWTNVTRQVAAVDVDYAATPNKWTSTWLSGIPILNPGNDTGAPQYWDLNPANRCATLTAWPANLYCRSIRAYKFHLVFVGITDAGVYYPCRVRWSTAAEPGTLPASYSLADPTNTAGQIDIVDGGDAVIDTLGLGDSLMIYKEKGVYRMDYVGGTFVMDVRRVQGMSGAMNVNCIAEIDGRHLVLTGSDIVVHDGFQAQSILREKARYRLFQDMDADALDRCHVSRNQFFTEVQINYPSIGGSGACDRALVYNWVTGTVTYKDLPPGGVHHIAEGAVDTSLGNTIDSGLDPIDSYIRAFDSTDYVPSLVKVLMACADSKLRMMDVSGAYDGELGDAYLERRNLDLGSRTRRKKVTGMRFDIDGNVGLTVNVEVAMTENENDEPVWSSPIAWTIGTTIQADFILSGRFFHYRLSTGTAYVWRYNKGQILFTWAGGW